MSPWPCMELLSPRNVIVCPWRWRNFTIDRISKSNNSIMWKISFTWTRGVLSVMEHLAHVDRLVAIRLEQLKRQNGMQWKVEFEVKIVLEQLEGISIKGTFSTYLRESGKVSTNYAKPRGKCAKDLFGQFFGSVRCLWRWYWWHWLYSWGFGARSRSRDLLIQNEHWEKLAIKMIVIMTMVMIIMMIVMIMMIRTMSEDQWHGWCQVSDLSSSRFCLDCTELVGRMPVIMENNL